MRSFLASLLAIVCDLYIVPFLDFNYNIRYMSRKKPLTQSVSLARGFPFFSLRLVGEVQKIPQFQGFFISGRSIDFKSSLMSYVCASASHFILKPSLRTSASTVAFSARTVPKIDSIPRSFATERPC